MATRVEKWEKKLRNILDDIDDILEDKFGNKYRLHPVRPKRGETSNKSMDGLFDVSANFTLGLGSEHGRGYVLKIKMVTLEDISEEIQEKVDQIAMEKLKSKLPEEFPDRELNVERDGNVIKVFGDLNLDNV